MSFVNAKLFFCPFEILMAHEDI